MADIFCLPFGCFVFWGERAYARGALRGGRHRPRRGAQVWMRPWSAQLCNTRGRSRRGFARRGGARAPRLTRAAQPVAAVEWDDMLYSYGAASKCAPP